VLADFSSFLGSLWFALLLGVVGIGFGFWYCRKTK
jgi:type II secretory pathway component PulF